MDVVEKVEKFKISSYDRTINYTSVKICLEKGMFFRDSQNYDSWVRMGLFIKGHFGDNDESYQLFDNFSRLGNNYEKNGKNTEIVIILIGFETVPYFAIFAIFFIIIS